MKYAEMVQALKNELKDPKWKIAFWTDFLFWSPRTGFRNLKNFDVGLSCLKLDPEKSYKYSVYRLNYGDVISINIEEVKEEA